MHIRRRLKKTHLPTFVYQCMYCSILLPASHWQYSMEHKKNPQFAISTICQCWLHTKQHSHLCIAVAPLQSHSERECEQTQSAVSPNCDVQLCVGQSIYINTILIKFWKTTNEVAFLKSTRWVWKPNVDTVRLIELSTPNTGTCSDASD